MKNNQSAENYLETILVLQKRGVVRSVDVANELNFSKPSVSVALKKLKMANHIEIDTKGGITLTESGETLAKAIYERHTVLTAFFLSIGVSAETAKNDACEIEHTLSKETFDCLKKYLNNK